MYIEGLENFGTKIKTNNPYVRTPNNPLGELTRAQYNVINLLTRGLENKQIAKLLHVKEQTVKFHLNNAYDTLHIHNRVEAAVLFLTWESAI